MLIYENELIIVIIVVDLLVYGSDSTIIHQLLTIAGDLAENTVHHTSLNDLIATHRKKHLGTFIDGTYMKFTIKLCFTNFHFIQGGAFC